MAYNLYSFANEEKFWESVIQKTQKILNPKNTEKVSICGSGGSAAQIFDKNIFLPQKEYEVFLADERFVLPNHPDSNAKLMGEKLSKQTDNHLKTGFGNNLELDQESVSGFGIKFQSWETEKFSDPKLCAQNYEKKIPKSFDLMILGVGPDGHTASLFPQIPELDEKTKKCVYTRTEAFSVLDRVSLTYPALLNSKNIFLLLMGQHKKEILEKITDPNNDFHQYPAKKILDEGLSVEIFFLDL